MCVGVPGLALVLNFVRRQILTQRLLNEVTGENAIVPLLPQHVKNFQNKPHSYTPTNKQKTYMNKKKRKNNITININIQRHGTRSPFTKQNLGAQ